MFYVPNQLYWKPRKGDEKFFVGKREEWEFSPIINEIYHTNRWVKAKGQLQGQHQSFLQKRGKERGKGVRPPSEEVE